MLTVMQYLVIGVGPVATAAMVLLILMYGSGPSKAVN